MLIWACFDPSVYAGSVRRIAIDMATCIATGDPLLGVSTIHFGGQPIVPGPQVHDERNGKIGGMFHLELDERGYLLELRTGDLEDKFVVDLEQHSCVEPVRGQATHGCGSWPP